MYVKFQGISKTSQEEQKGRAIIEAGAKEGSAYVCAKNVGLSPTGQEIILAKGWSVKMFLAV